MDERRGKAYGRRRGWSAPRRNDARAHSPKYRYPGEATRRLLAALPAGQDGARTLRYTNPATGGAVMPALDCYAMRLAKGAATRPKRVTCNMICLVVSGERPIDRRRAYVPLVASTTSSRFRIGISRAITASGGDADLFIVSDRSAFERLDLVREEYQ